MLVLFDFLWPYLVGGLIGWLLCGILARNLLKYSLIQEKPVVVTNTRTVEVDNPKHVKRAAQLEAEVYLLKSREPEQVEVEIEVEVEKRVTVNNPAHLERVVALEQQLNHLHKQPAKTETIEKTTEIDNPKHLERIANLEDELNVLRSQPAVEKTVEKEVEVDNPIHLQRIAELESQLAEILNEKVGPVVEPIEKISAPTDIMAAKAAGFSIKTGNDFTVVEGIGPKINEYLHAEGIETYAIFSQTGIDVIQQLLNEGGKRFRLAKPATWPQQASLAAENRWQELKAWQDNLRGGG